MQNAWLLYRRVANEQGLDALEFLGFTRRVALCYLSSGEQPSRGRPSTRMTASYKVLSEVRYDRLDHLIVSTDKQVRCALCYKTSTTLVPKVQGLATRGLFCFLSQKVVFLDWTTFDESK